MICLRESADESRSGVSNTRPAGHLWPAKPFKVARQSFQKLKKIGTTGNVAVIAMRGGEDLFFFSFFSLQLEMLLCFLVG